MRLHQYPFGMVMQGRFYVPSSNYRYGFNGKENNDEVKGESNQIDYGARVYDPRVGRFLSLDPLQKKYPELTPYQFSSNSPIANVDLDGRESEYYTMTITYTTVHRTDDQGDDHTFTTSSTAVKHETTGWFTQGNIYTPNGALGSGNLYTVKTQTKDVYESAMGFTEEKLGEPITIGRDYKLSATDVELRNEKIDRPQFTGDYQIMILGSGNGQYPGDQTGDKPNPNARTEVISIKEWNDIFEPVLLGMDVKSPLEIEPPSFNEILGEGFQQAVDKYKDAADEYENLKTENGVELDKYEPNKTVCASCGGNPHGLNDVKTGNNGQPLYIIKHGLPVYDDKTKKIIPAKNDTIPLTTKPNN